HWILNHLQQEAILRDSYPILQVLSTCSPEKPRIWRVEIIQTLTKMLNEKKQYVSNLETKRIDLFDRGTTGCGEDNVLLASCKCTSFSPMRYFSLIGYMHAAMTNQQLIDSGNRMMDKTDQAVGGTINVGTEAAAALKDQLVNPNNKDIRDILGLAPPAMGWKLLWSAC
ncbi:putative plant snare 11, partial [Quercus suber]